MIIALAADHRGQIAKGQISILLQEMGHKVLDMGTNSSKSCDYPDVAFPAAKAVSDDTAQRGVFFCATGIGMSICANKVNGIRAALCHDEVTAQMSRRHNNTNVLCLASDVLGDELIRRIVVSWLETDFEGGGRHERRINKISTIETQCDPASQSSNDDLRDN